MVKTLETIDHTVEADKNLLSQYQSSPLLESFIDSFVAELNEVETEITLFDTVMSLANSEGANLNLWGIILQASQRPVSDEEFRVLLYALVGAYNSEGTATDIRSLILSVLRADDIFIDDNGGATFSFTVFNPVFNFGPELVSDIVNLAKPGGVEFLGFNVSDIYTEDTFAFVGDTRARSTGFGVAVPSKSALTNWTNYIFAPEASITDTRRIYYEVNVVTRESSIVFVTATADTQWRTDIANQYAGVVGAIVGWEDEGGTFYNIITLSTDGTVIDAGAIGDSYYTKLQLINNNGVTIAAFQVNNATEVGDNLQPWEPDFSIPDTHAAITLAQTLQDDPFDVDVYGIRDGGRLSVTII